MIIGITGSIGCGKTTVSELFRERGFEVINIDQLYHDLIKPGSEVYKKITGKFGNSIINKDKTINRGALKKIVFADYKKLRALNGLTHPSIIKEAEKIIKYLKKYGKPNIVIDAPLLLESNARKLVDKIIVVKCREENQIKRVLKKNIHTKKQIENIIKSQMPLDEKLKHADFVIDNNKNLKYLSKQVINIIKKLK